MTKSFLVLLIGLLITACNGQEAATASSSDSSSSNEPPINNNPAATAQQQMQQGLDQLAQLQQNNEREGVFDQETLKALLPANLLGMPKDPNSENTNVVKMGEVEMANGEATYRDPDQRNRRIILNIADGFGSQATGANMSYVSGMDIQDGTKHTFTKQLDGQTALVGFDSENGHANLTVVHGQTTIVLEGFQLDNETQIISAYEELSLGSL
ncbi:MAG: hypothetical protein AAF433_17920 [Bacteroidota bacterium]